VTVKNHSENHQSPAPNVRKPYAKPSVRKVPLRPDEAVLGGCKKTGQSGPLSGDCQSPAACSGTNLS
jgi:hypothetical protein